MKFYLSHPEFNRLQLNIRNILNLYFEDAYLFEGHGDNQLEIHQNEHGIEVALTIDNQHYQHQLNKSSDDFKVFKRHINECLIYMLTKHTGMHQSWGVLTGIRPTKLYHQMVQKGASHEAIKSHLKHTYLIDDEKIDLMRDIVKVQHEAIPDLYQLQDEVSIYIGIPFCPTKCAYCTFPAYAIQIHKKQVPEFLVGLLFEIEQIGQWLKTHQKKITTIYFGGGTPTSIKPEELKLLIEACYKHFDMTHVRELTIEAGRPDTIDEATLKVLNDYDIDRISINPQSFTDETLKAIGRHHTVQETIDKFELSRAFHMNNINMDLIIGLPNETLTEMKHSLSEIKRLNPESLTVHTLSFKRASEMTRNKDKYQVADRTEVIKMMQLSQTFAKEHGYIPYYLYRQKNILGNLENIGYAKANQSSLYNILIMEELQTIIGLGCGASSKFIHPKTKKIENYLNPKDPKSYNETYQHYTEMKINKLNALFDVESSIS